MPICVNCVEALSKITYKHFLTVIPSYLTQERDCRNNLRWFLELVKLNSVLPPACECLQEFPAQHPLDAESKTVAEGSLSQHQDNPGRFLLLDIEKKKKGGNSADLLPKQAQIMFFLVTFVLY